MPAGGLRLNAGRKPKEITKMRKNFAEKILSDASEQSKWKKLLDSKSEKIALDAIKAISEFKHGKAKQSIDLDANVNVVASVVVNV